MAEENNGANTGAEDSSKDGQPANKPDASSENKPDATEQARRDQQSKKDKAVSEKDDLAEQVSYLSARDAERARDDYIGELLSDKEKYPNVDKTDPLFKYATSKDEVQEIAITLQNKFTDMQQNALRSVQSEPEFLTDEQIATKEKQMEEETLKTGKSNFGSFMETITRRKR